MARILAEIVAANGTGIEGDAVFVRSRYIDHPAKLACTVAIIEGVLVGFQILKRAWEGNPYDVPGGWGIIGTHISPEAARRGVGRILFAASRDAAAATGLVSIDATIGAGNADGLAYYAAMGFRTWREPDGAVCKRYDLTATSA